ncbi:MAG: purine-nucleoside phosphorylase [Actinomycetota bacterium]
MNPYAAAADAAQAIAKLTAVDRHDVAIVLGSGWGEAASQLGPVAWEGPLSEVPGIPRPTVGGHRGRLVSVDAGGRRVLVLAGRSHLYEGHSVHTVVHAVRAAVLAGCEVVILTNAAGGLDPHVVVGTPVLITDHLNLTGTSPMVGEDPPEEFGGRFCDLTGAYDSRLRDLARGIDGSLPNGVYAGLLGGNFETPAEIRMLRTLGADLVGMSTVLETIAARHLGARVLGISLVTNLAAGIAPAPLAHAEVLEAGKAAGPRMTALLRGVVAGL